MSTAKAPSVKQSESIGSEPAVFEVFFDGECPLCLREIHLLRRMDRRKKIRFTDIARDDFDASSVGVSWQTLMDQIHGRLPDGTLVRGVEVFRHLYAAVGLSRLVAMTRLPGIRQGLDGAYRVFAKNRLRWTGRCTDGACGLGAPRRARSDDAATAAG